MLSHLIIDAGKSFNTSHSLTMFLIIQKKKFITSMKTRKTTSSNLEVLTRAEHAEHHGVDYLVTNASEKRCLQNVDVQKSNCVEKQ